MELQGDVGHVESHFFLFESCFAPNVPLVQKLFWTHLMVHLGDEAQVKAHFGPFGDSANLDAR